MISNSIKLLRVLPCFLALFSGSGVKADSGESFFLMPSLSYYQMESSTRLEWGEGKQTTNRSILNATIGYNFAGGLLLGVKYLEDTQSLTNKPSWTSTTTNELDKINGIAGSIGFLTDQVFLMFSVFAIQAPIFYDDATTVEYTEGSGSMLELAYFADLGICLFGPLIAWRSLEYKKYNNLQDESDSTGQDFIKMNQTLLEPYISLLYFF